jgi:hypothetical protein
VVVGDVVLVEGTTGRFSTGAETMVVGGTVVVVSPGRTPVERSALALA